MRVIKYFFEEPTLLDLADDPSEERPVEVEDLLSQNRHCRGYLAASDLESGAVGGSSLDDGAAADVLAQVLDLPVWFSNVEPGQELRDLQLISNRATLRTALLTMSSGSVMITNWAPEQEEVDDLTADQDRKRSMATISRLLDQGATVVFPEPAHVGHDWSIFSASPLADSVRKHLPTTSEDTRYFVIPFGQARGEHKFYFEQYDVDLFAEYEVI